MSEGEAGELDTVSSPTSPASLPSNNLSVITAQWCMWHRTQGCIQHTRGQCHYLKNYLLWRTNSWACKRGKCSDPLLSGPQGDLFLKKGKPLIFYIRQIQITTSSKLPMIPCIMFPRESSVRGNQWFQLFRYKVALKLSPL